MIPDFGWQGVSSVCSVSVKFNIDFSFCEMRMLYWIKFTNAYAQRERKNLKDFVKGMLKIPS